MPDVASDLAVAALWGGDCRASAVEPAVVPAEGEAKSRSAVTRRASGTSSMRRKSSVEEERKVAVGSEELKGGGAGRGTFLRVDFDLMVVFERRRKRRKKGETEVEESGGGDVERMSFGGER